MSIASAEVTAKLSIAIETQQPANNVEVGSATEAFNIIISTGLTLIYLHVVKHC